MSVHRIKGVNLEALACAVPKQKYTLTDYAPNLVDEKTARDIERVSGFHALRISPDDMTTSDLCCAAAKKIFDAQKDAREKICALLFVSKTPDYTTPATSHVLQSRLELPDSVICLDINEGCPGFVVGFFTAASIAAQTGGSVLLCGGDTNSKLTSENDRATRCIFGDGTFAALVSADEMSELAFSIESYGAKSEAIIMENRYRIVDAPKNDGHMFMDGSTVMHFTLTQVPKVIKSFLDELKISKDDINFFAFHQANKLMLTTLTKKLGIPQEKVPFTADEIGNTSSATIPLVLSSKAGQADFSRVMCAGFGTGLSVGLCLADFSRTKFYGTFEI